MPCLNCSCLEGILLPPRNYAEEREAFEQTVAFLGSVPLFRNHLPRSDWPLIAKQMTRKEWHRGAYLVRQGEKGRAFFLIRDGEAKVYTTSDKHEEVERATLCAGDYFGGHTLLNDRTNVASIVAGKGLVTLSLSQSQFNDKDSGLGKKIEFTKRQAFYNPDGSEVVPSTKEPKYEPLLEEEVSFVVKAFHKNANFHALIKVEQAKLEALASKARKISLKKDECMDDQGKGSNSFFIVKEGSIEVVIDDRMADKGQQRSAEAVVASSTMAERFLRKQNILQELTQNRRQPVARASVCGPDDKNVRPKPAAQQRMASEHDSWMTAPRGNKMSPGTASVNLAMNFTKSTAQTAEAKDDKQVATAAQPMQTVLGPQDSFGELAVLYNLNLRATFCAREDSVVYEIPRSKFAGLYATKGKRLKEYLSLLEEVHMLLPLLSTERMELARNAIGFVEFKPGERVLRQGVERLSKQWYVLKSGKALIILDEEREGKSVTQVLATLSRGGHFGERSLLNDKWAPPVSVEAGPEGMTCLIFDGLVIRDLLKKGLKFDESLAQKVDGDIRSWWVRKAKGFKVETMTGTRSMNVTSRLSRADSDIVHFGDLRRVCELGRGGCGAVTLVEDSGRRRYALKTLSKGFIKKQGSEVLVNSERELLSMTNSPFVIKLVQTFKDSQHIYFLLEAVLGGSLMDVLRKQPEVLGADSPRGSAAAFYVACITQAVDHLHERMIVHRDLKPENALLDERGYAKLCDMGFARFVLSKTNTLAGTPDYMAPEMIDFPHQHDMSVDWWALGVLTYELLAGQTPFEDEGITDPRELLLAIRRSQEKGQLSYPFTFPNIAKGFIGSLLQTHPEKRLGAGAKGADEVREAGMFKALKFNWEAHKMRQLPSPFQKKWTDPPEAKKLEAGNLGLSPDDELFCPGEEDVCDWDGDF
mmetsp:Transcript_11189/g.25464  ORF Transcript_11189/g.25464 Transcript_11189/m.25464 type:complete len:927 (+) Transcript_11189:62-2842(+)